MALLHLFYFLLGLITGSFLNVCIYRLPRKESIVFPGSRCPQCRAGIRPYDNVPVFAYLWLRGKCRFCKSRISLQYPAVEFVTGVCFLLCSWYWQFEVPTFVNSVFISLIIVLVVIDYHHQILPNVVTLPGFAAGLLLSPFQDPVLLDDPLSSKLAGYVSPGALPWTASLLGAIVGGGILLMVGLAYQVLRKKQGLGMGDVKMMAFVGAFLGWRLSLLTVFVGSLLGSVIGILLVLVQGRSLQSKLAFGTFLGAAAMLALFWGPSILEWYLPSP